MRQSVAENRTERKGSNNALYEVFNSISYDKMHDFMKKIWIQTFFWWNTQKSATMEYEIVYGAKLSIWRIEEKLVLSPQYFLDGRWLWKNNRPIWDSCATAFYYRPLISFELMFCLNFRTHFNFAVENIPYVSGYNFLWLF